MSQCTVSPEVEQKVSELRFRIANYENWIATNRYDTDGVKDRREWIEECQAEIENLTSQGL